MSGWASWATTLWWCPVPNGGARRTPTGAGVRQRRAAPARTQQQEAPGSEGGPVEVRFIGHKGDVRRWVEAFTRAAGNAAGPASYRPIRYGDGIRAYLTIATPPGET